MKREGTVFFLLMMPRMTVIRRTGMFPPHHHHTYYIRTAFSIMRQQPQITEARNLPLKHQSIPCMLEEKHTWRKLEKSSMHNILTDSIFYIFNEKNMKIDNYASSILLPLSFFLVHFTTKTLLCKCSHSQKIYCDSFEIGGRILFVVSGFYVDSIIHSSEIHFLSYIFSL